MKIRDPQKLAENLLGAMNSKASGTSKVALAWFLALVFLWLGSLEPLVPQLNALYDKSRQEFLAVSELRTLKAGDSGGNEDRLQKRVQGLTVQLRDVRAERVKQVQALKVAFSVPGFPNFDVPVRLASLAWSILLLGLLLYLAFARLAILKWIGQAARLLYESESPEVQGRPPVAFFLPWWVAPLPSRDGSCVSAIDFRSLVGWRSSRPAMVAVIGALFLLCALQFRVTLIGINGAFALSHSAEARGIITVLIGASIAAQRIQCRPE